MSAGPGGEETDLPDPRVLGWLLAAQNVLQALPTGRQQGEFLARALRDVPGVSRGGLCLLGSEDESCERPCPALERGYGAEPPRGCGAGPQITQFPLSTSQGRYGWLVVEVGESLLFAPYEPFLVNFAGSLALVAETREQKRRLEESFEQLSESESRYRQLFSEMTSGLAVHEIVLDEQGRACDYRFLEVNEAFEKLTGIRGEDVIGRRVLEILPGLESSWIERYGGVALTGEPISFEEYSRDLDRYYDVVAYRPRAGQFATIFTDVTSRRLMERELRRTAEELAAANEELRARNDEQSSLVRRLQEVLVDIPQDLPGVHFGHLYRSATKDAQVGGDFYDVFEARHGRVGLLVGDVSGHGVEAARIATLVKDTIRVFAHQFRHPHRVLRETNRLLADRRLPAFVTVWLGYLEPATGELVYSSAGHPPPVLMADHRIAFLKSSAFPLGVFADARYRDSEVETSKGSLLVLYTDGLTEARRDGVLLGEEGVVAILERRRGSGVRELPSLVLEDVLAFSGGHLGDDVAILAVEYGDKAQGGASG